MTAITCKSIATTRRSPSETIVALESRDVDLIIGVTHLHMWQDVELAGLKAEHPKLAFIVGGHEHEPQYSPAGDTSAAVMKGASNARVIWQIDVEFDSSGGYAINEKRIDLDESIPFDPEYEVLADKWNDRLLKSFPSSTHVSAPRRSQWMFVRRPLEARRRAGAISSPTRCVLHLVSQMRTSRSSTAGTLRIDDYIEEDILFEDIGRTFGFSSFLRYTMLTGAEFKRVMEAGYRGGPEAQGYFPQISGFSVCVDRSRNEFDRIVSLQVPVNDGWQEIEPDKEYVLVVPDFLFGGGDGYEIPKDRFASRPGSELKYLVLDAILGAQGQGEAVGVPVTNDNRRYHQLREGKQPCFQ